MVVQLIVESFDEWGEQDNEEKLTKGRMMRIDKEKQTHQLNRWTFPLSNGSATNGLKTNGLQTNGLQTNGLQTNGLQTNGLQKYSL